MDQRKQYYLKDKSVNRQHFIFYNNSNFIITALCMTSLNLTKLGFFIRRIYQRIQTYKNIHSVHTKFGFNNINQEVSWYLEGYLVVFYYQVVPFYSLSWLLVYLISKFCLSDVFWRFSSFRKIISVIETYVFVTVWQPRRFFSTIQFYFLITINALNRRTGWNSFFTLIPCSMLRTGLYYPGTLLIMRRRSISRERRDDLVLSFLFNR